MSARRKSKPAGPLKPGWNVHKFPCGKASVRLTQNQRARAQFVSMSRGYDSFFHGSQELWERNHQIKRGLAAVDRALDQLWGALEDAGVVRD